MSTPSRKTRRSRQVAPVEPTQKCPSACEKSHARAEMVFAPAKLTAFVDMAFIAQHMPKFKLKDLVVIAMAFGGRLTMPTPSNGREPNPLDVRIEWEVGPAR
jgi:hypothetical protein